MKIPIIIDTNVLISGYLWSGKPRQAIKIVGDPPYELLYCHESLTELVRIISDRKKEWREYASTVDSGF